MEAVQAAAAEWQPGDDPTTHPLWEKQVELERRMMREGSNNYRARYDKAKRRQQTSHLRPQRSLLKAWLPDMADGIKQFVRDCRLQRGIKPVSYEYLRETDPYLAGYITIRNVLNNIATGRHTNIMSVARSIGTNLEHEARMRAWEDRDPELFHGVQRSLKRQGATTEWRSRVNINRFNKLMREDLEWSAWPRYDRTRIGLDLIDILVRYIKQFKVITDPAHEKFGGLTPEEAHSGGVRSQAYWVLAASDELAAWITKAHDRAELMSPVYQPTLIPPKRWEGTRKGAYYTEYVRPPYLVKFKAQEEGQARGAADEYDAMDMPKVFEALHAIQEVPWKVNNRVYAVAMECWERDLAIAGLPMKEPEPLPAEVPDDAPEELIKANKRARSIIRGRNNRRVSTILATDRTLVVARRFLGQQFYFPHMMDFRGRMYPIPVDFQPQGRDLARGLLTFAEGRPLGPGGGWWLAVHLANCFGHDKVPFEERVQWVVTQEDRWRAISADPMKHRDWADADSPWQALAAIFEFVAALDHGDEYVSHLPIRVDGTCNGLQHLSAMIRDKVGGAAVNLVPSAEPNDIYRDVATRLTDRLWEIGSTSTGKIADRARWWLDLTGEALPRSLTKRPVMILPYGGTQNAYYQYTRDWLDENHAKEAEALASKVFNKKRRVGGGKKGGKPKTKLVQSSELAESLGVLVTQMWEAVTDKLGRAIEVMKWLQSCAKLAARDDQPVFWITPDGFVVRHFYPKYTRRQIKIRVNGQRVDVVDEQATTKLDVKEQIKGIPPNFVHSLDATAARMTITRARSQGITSVTAIHDAFGALAADMEPLCRIIREAFVEVHEVDVLGEFRRACQTVLADHIAFKEQEDREVAFERAGRLMPKPIKPGDLDLAGVLESDYFFA